MEPGTPDYIVKDQIAGGSTEPTLANPVACSGVFIELYKSGRLHEVCSMIVQVERAWLSEQRAGDELSNINNLFSLARAAVSTPDRLLIKLKERAAKWETQRTQAQEKLSQLRRQLDAQYHGLFAYLENHRDQIDRPSLFRPRSKKISPNRQLVAERNRVIREHAEKSDRAICDELDEAFWPSDKSRVPQIPESWHKDFKVVTFKGAYLNSACRPRVQSMISRVLKGLRRR